MAKTTGENPKNPQTGTAENPQPEATVSGLMQEQIKEVTSAVKDLKEIIEELKDVLVKAYAVLEAAHGKHVNATKQEPEKMFLPIERKNKK